MRLRGVLGCVAHNYDANGQRIRSVITSEAGGLPYGSFVTTTTYDYDGITLIGYGATRSDGVTWSVDYVSDEAGRPFGGVYAGGGDRVPFLMVSTDRGDVRELVDSNGSAFAHYAYDAYGNPLATLSTATASVAETLAAQIASRQLLRCAGYVFDAESGLYYCSQRYYDPKTAAFLSKDPARADGEESAYQYCGGDPVGSVDPTGLWSRYEGIPLVGAVTGKELVLARLWPVSAALVAMATTAAWHSASARFSTTSLNEGDGDAYRHAYWNALGTKYLARLWWSDRVGRVRMRDFAHAHENYRTNHKARKKMDLTNNYIGREIGWANRKSSDATIRNKVWLACMNGRLRKLKFPKRTKTSPLVRTGE